MEDRSTPGLYLELGDMAPDEYASGRARELARLAGVDRVSWWETLVPGRKELPMEIPDGTLLGVAETGTRTSAPPALAGFVSHNFRRHSRPAQGILSGAPTRGLLVVWISPKDKQREQELRDWADFVHIRHIAAAAIPGFTLTTVYENIVDGDPRFMHFYELDTDDPEAAYQSMARAVARNLGGGRTEAFRHWADYDRAGGRLIYCNTFRLVGDSAKPAD